MNNFYSPLDENFTYGYDDGYFNLRKSEDSRFCCYYKKASYIPKSFKEECIRVCCKIADVAEDLGRIPTILLSGGLDSEIVVRAFIDSGRKFQVVSNRFAKEHNQHELFYIERFVQDKKINVEYVDIDIEKWLPSQESLELADISKCPYSEMLPTMKLIKEVWFERNGLPILGNGDFYAVNNGGSWEYVELEYIVAWMRYCNENRIISAVNFFQLTPEITLSMALDPLMQNTISKNKHPNVRSTKYLVYKKNWIDVSLREKFNGAEKIQKLCDSINDEYLSKYSIYTSKWTMPLENYLELLMPQ